MPKIVTVTGGSGYVGRHLIARLSAAGHAIRNIDLLPPFKPQPNEVWLPHDIRTPLPANLLQDSPVLVHLAALIDAAESVREAEKYRETNIGGTRNVLEAASIARLPRIIFASSAAVYGAHDGECSEQTPATPTNPYGATKLTGEHMCASLVENGEIGEAVSFRFFNIMGINSAVARPSGAANLFKSIARRAVLGQPLEIYGNDHATPDGYAVRDFIHVEDIVDGLMLAITSDRAHGLYNLGSGHPTSVRQVVNAAQAILPTPIPINMASRRAGEVSYSLADSRAVRAALNWAPTRSHNIEAALREEYEAAAAQATAAA